MKPNTHGKGSQTQNEDKTVKHYYVYVRISYNTYDDNFDGTSNHSLTLQRNYVYYRD